MIGRTNPGRHFGLGVVKKNLKNWWKRNPEKLSNLFVEFPVSVWVCATNFLVPQKPQKFWSSENNVIIPAGATTYFLRPTAAPQTVEKQTLVGRK